MKNLCLLTCLVLLASCQQAQKESTEIEARFFDLKNYISAEIERLNQEQPNVRKKVAINGKTEEHDFHQLHYEKELDVFLQSDINRLAWYDKYQVDSLMENGQLKTLIYKATDPKLKTQKLEINLANAKVESIHIANQSYTFIATAQQTAIYQPDSGYSFESLQSNILGSKRDISMEVQF
ncbi:MAG TPA: hypothetical protein PKA00_17870 [Saprospiraceae bacterium]|nr:hypothetical protein [Saprospiraceae bacterium]HMQ84790.1 hypothetical protein [Saprospiraceae bacterium]